MRSFAENQAFLEEHPELLCEHAMGYLLMEALSLGMDGKAAAMKRVVRQKFHIKSLLEFAEARKAPIRDVVKPFFERLAGVPAVAAEYDAACEATLAALVKRAAEKVKERDEEAARAAAEGGDDAVTQLSREERLGPGGLDPVEVFEQLPQALQEAYESKDVGRLRSHIDGLPLPEARRVMKLMVDSGLWVPEPGAEGSLLTEPQGAEG